MPRSGLIPARNHWCLHNDQLAQQFDGILNLTQTFPGCAKSPEGSIFYAPLSSNLNEVVAGLPFSYLRSLEGLYEPTPGRWAIAAPSVPRFESGHFLMEPAATNKNLNYNANPDAALTGILASGDPNVVVTRVQDAQRLDNAGLTAVCTSGYVIDVDNSAGTGFAQCYIDGPCGNTNIHSWSMWARSLNGLCRVQSTNGQQVVEVTSTEEYERFSVIGANSVGGAFLSLYVAAGAHGRFVLNGLVEENVLSTPIITRGASASRGPDLLFYPGIDSVFNQPEGMAVIDWRPKHDKSALTSSNRNLLSLNNSTDNLLYVNDSLINSSTGATISSAPYGNFLANELVRAVVTYGPGAGTFIVGSWHNGAWTWDPTPANYDGAFPSTDALTIALNISYPWWLNNITLYDVNQGTAWVETNLTP